MQHADRHSGTISKIDELDRHDALSSMLMSHLDAATVVSHAIADIDIAAECLAQALTAGRTVHYAAAGSSALMALADACELPGTFGVAQNQIRICMAGGVPVDAAMPGHVEDSCEGAIAAAQRMTEGDIAIVISASGTTPYAMAFANTAKAQRNTVIAIANVAGSDLLKIGDVAIALPTAPEVLDGSTRLGAGTAQKVALNMMSTQAGILMGHVHEGLMVNLKPDNIKLRKRAAGIVATITGISTDAADVALSQSDFDTKLAILIAKGENIEDARKRLAKAGGHLKECLPNQDINI